MNAVRKKRSKVEAGSRRRSEVAARKRLISDHLSAGTSTSIEEGLWQRILQRLTGRSAKRGRRKRHVVVYRLS